MATDSRSLTPLAVRMTLYRWHDRGMEALWLLAVFLVPLAFLDPDYAKSEAIIGYLEVPKIALLRLLTGMMAILWLVRWGLSGRLSFPGLAQVKGFAWQPVAWKSWVATYLEGNPGRWIILAVAFYLATTLISTALSGSFPVSMWGEVPGQDGYSAYNITAYVLLFGILATHLKTQSQLWRFLAAIVVMGVVVGGYALLQHNGHDLLNLAEETGGLTTAFMGNTIFAGAVLMMTIPITLTAAIVSLLSLPNIGIADLKRVGGWWPHVALWGIWIAVLSIQILGLIFTLSRGPWIGAMTAVVVMLGIVTVLGGKRAIIRFVLLSIVTLAVIGFVILDPTFEFGGEGGDDEASISTTDASTSKTEAKDESPTPTEPAPAEGNGDGTDILDAASSVSVELDPVATDVADQLGSIRSVSVELDPVATDVADQFGSIRAEVVGGFTGGRGTHWRVSWSLIRNHPWFEFETLSLRRWRPIFGYGPDLFRYTYLLESPPEGPNLYPLEPDHAHNYFIHQTVEQGFLGLVSFVGVFTAVFLVGVQQLLRFRRSLTTAHLVILAGLLAVAIGRSLEMMAGVARVSDLTILWASLGVFAALPAVMRPAEENAANASLNQRERRRIPPRADQPSGIKSPDWNWAWRLAVVAWLTGGIVMLTWFKAVSYPLAAVKAAEAVGHWRRIDLPSTLADLEAAIALAPDVPAYHQWRTSVYLAYASGRIGPLEEQCSLQKEQPYEKCLGQLAYQSSRLGSQQSPYYYRSRLFAANTAASLSLQDQAAQYYQETSDLVPGSWKVQNGLAESYLRQGQPEIALRSLEKSLTITAGTQLSDIALYLMGIAYQAMGQSQKSIESFQNSLNWMPAGPLAGKAHVQLAGFYIKQEDWEQALRHLSLNIAGNSGDPVAVALRGKAHLAAEQYEDSLIDYEEAVKLGTAAEVDELGESLAIVLTARGESLSNQGLYWPAIGEFNKAIWANRRYSPAYRERGSAHSELGLKNQAKRDFEDAVRLDPEDEEARALLDGAS